MLRHCALCFHTLTHLTLTLALQYTYRYSFYKWGHGVSENSCDFSLSYSGLNGREKADSGLS